MNSSAIVTALFLLHNCSVLSNSVNSASQVRLISKDTLPEMKSLTDFNAESLVQCSAACQLRGFCKSFAFHKGNSNCLLYAEMSSLKMSAHYGYAYYAEEQVHEVTSALTSSTTTTASGIRNVRFEVYTTANLTFNEAQSNCKQTFKGQLACIHSDAVQEEVNDIIKGKTGCDRFWIGLQKVDKGNYVYKWMDAKIFDNANKLETAYQNWDTLYPSSIFLGQSNVAIMVPGSGKWREMGNSNKYCSICEIPA